MNFLHLKNRQLLYSASSRRKKPPQTIAVSEKDPHITLLQNSQEELNTLDTYKRPLTHELPRKEKKVRPKQNELPLYEEFLSSQHMDGVRESIAKYCSLKVSQNQIMKSMVFADLQTQLRASHPLFSHLDQPLIEALLLLGKMELLRVKEYLDHPFDNLNIVIYGRVKITCKDFKIVLGEGEMFGEHSLYGGTMSAEVIVQENSCLFSLPLHLYKLLRKESIVHGFKQEFTKFQSLVRLSFIGKGLSQKEKKKLQ